MDEFEKEISQATGQRNEEWQAQRLGKFTSSRFSDMMKSGRSKKEKFGQACINYVYEKIAEIMTGSAHNVTSQATDWGNDFEEEAIKRYEKETGNKVTKIGFIDYNEYAGGSPDGFVGEDGIIEVKCPFNPSNHIKSMLNKYYYNPDHDFQVQGNLMVTGRKYCDFITYDPRVLEEALQYSCFRVYRDEEKITSIQERLKEVKELMNELMQINLKIL